MIILIANPKGGTGKTMLAHQLALTFPDSQGQKALVDLDMGTKPDSVLFKERRCQNQKPLPYSLYIYPEDRIKPDYFRKLDEDLIFVDSVCRLDNRLNIAVFVADKIIVPINCSPISYHTTSQFLKQHIGNSRMLALIIEFPCTKDEIESTRMDIQSRFRIPVVSKALPWLDQIATAMGMGYSYAEIPYSSQSTQAIKLIETIMQEIMDFIYS